MFIKFIQPYTVMGRRLILKNPHLDFGGCSGLMTDFNLMVKKHSSLVQMHIKIMQAGVMPSVMKVFIMIYP